MAFSLDDTIAAIASPPDAALRGIIRLSGWTVPALVERLPIEWEFSSDAELAQEIRESSSAFEPTASNNPSRPQIPSPVNRSDDGTARVGHSQLPLDGEVRLPGWIWYWPTHRSFTGQPALEFHTIGAPHLLQLAMEFFLSQGVRMARPGEFTLRAFLQGRLDLMQAEAVLGVVQSQTEEQFRQALTQLAGGIRGPMQTLRSELLDLLADLEAGLDFVEEDISFIDRDQVRSIVDRQLDVIARWLDQIQQRHFWDGAIRVVFSGLPNVGKSSLFNAMVGTNQAIVSPQAGTTTDFLAARIRYADRWLEFVDTAGWMLPLDLWTWQNPRQELPASAAPPTLSAIDLQAHEHLRQQWEQADVRLLCLDLSRCLTPVEETWLQHARQDPRTIVVGTKQDLERPTADSLVDLRTCAEQSQGILDLFDAILANFDRDHQNDETQFMSTTALRCADHLRAAEQCLQAARQLTVSGEPDELIAAEIRAALDPVGQIIGVVYTDDLLDRIFSRFCIGK